MSPDDWRLDRTGRREAEQVLERVVLHEDEGQLLFQQSTNRRRKGVQEWITEVSLGHTQRSSSAAARLNTVNRFSHLFSVRAFDAVDGPQKESHWVDGLVFLKD